MAVLDMICSSVSMTSMICFSMEVKYGHLSDTDFHMEDTRVAARGNDGRLRLRWQVVAHGQGTFCEQ